MIRLASGVMGVILIALVSYALVQYGLTALNPMTIGLGVGVGLCCIYEAVFPVIIGR